MSTQSTSNSQVRREYLFTTPFATACWNVREKLLRNYRITEIEIDNKNSLHHSAFFINVNGIGLLFIKSTYLSIYKREDYFRGKNIETLTLDIGNPQKILEKVKSVEDVDTLYNGVICAVWSFEAESEKEITLKRIPNRWIPTAELKYGVAYEMITLINRNRNREESLFSKRVFHFRVHEPHFKSYRVAIEEEAKELNKVSTVILNLQSRAVPEYNKALEGFNKAVSSLQQLLGPLKGNRSLERRVIEGELKKQEELNNSIIGIYVFPNSKERDALLEAKRKEWETVNKNLLPLTTVTRNSPVDLSQADTHLRTLEQSYKELLDEVKKQDVTLTELESYCNAWRQINSRLQELIKASNNAGFQPTLRAYTEETLFDPMQIKKHLWALLFKLYQQTVMHYSSLHKPENAQFRKMVLERIEEEIAFFEIPIFTNVFKKFKQHLDLNRLKSEFSTLKDFDKYLTTIEQQPETIRIKLTNDLNFFISQACERMRDSIEFLLNRYYLLYSNDSQISAKLEENLENCLSLLLKRIGDYDRFLQKYGYLRKTSDKEGQKLEYLDASYAKTRKILDSQIFLLEWKLVISTYLENEQLPFSEFHVHLFQDLSRRLSMRFVYGLDSIAFQFPEESAMTYLKRVSSELPILLEFLKSKSQRIVEKPLASLLTSVIDIKEIEKCEKVLSSIRKNMSSITPNVSSQQEVFVTLRKSYLEYKEMREKFYKQLKQLEECASQIFTDCSPSHMDKEKARCISLIDETLSVSLVPKELKNWLLTIKHQLTNANLTAQELQNQMMDTISLFKDRNVENKSERESIQRTIRELKALAEKIVPDPFDQLLKDLALSPIKTNDLQMSEFSVVKKKMEDYQNQLCGMDQDNAYVKQSGEIIKQIPAVFSSNTIIKLKELVKVAQEVEKKKKKEKNLESIAPAFSSLKKLIETILQSILYPKLINQLDRLKIEIEKNQIRERMKKFLDVIDKTSEGLVITTWIDTNQENIQFVRWSGAPIDEDPYNSYNNTHIPFPELVFSTSSPSSNNEEIPSSEGSDEMEKSPSLPSIEDILNKIEIMEAYNQECKLSDCQELLLNLGVIRSGFSTGEYDDIFNNLYNRILELYFRTEKQPYKTFNPKGARLYGTFNQFSLKKRDGSDWSKEASRSSCTINALTFLSFSSSGNPFEHWKKETETDPKNNIINTIIDEGRERFEKILKVKKEEFGKLLTETQEKEGGIAAQNLLWQQGSDALHVSEIKNTEAIFFVSQCGSYPTINLIKDKKASTTTEHFKLILNNICEVMKKQSLSYLGAIIHFNGSTYAVAFLGDSNKKLDYCIFDSHGSFELNGRSDAFVYWTENLDDAAYFLGNLMKYIDIGELSFLPKEVTDLLAAEYQSQKTNQLAIYLFKPIKYYT